MDDDTKRKSRERLERAITPIGSGGGSRTYSRTPPTAKLPDWDFWRNMPEVEWHEACALALNIDPDSIKRHPENWMVPEADIFLPESFSSTDVEQRFYKLLRLLNGNLSNRQHFTATHQNTVRLSEFAAWCAHIDWDIPPELAALAKDVPQAAPAAKVEAAPATSAPQISQANKLRRDVLDPAIDKAVEQAGSMELADVYLKLKELAKDEEPPFTGIFDGDALCYTDTNDKPAQIPKEALGKRLKRRAGKAATN